MARPPVMPPLKSRRPLGSKIRTCPEVAAPRRRASSPPGSGRTITPGIAAAVRQVSALLHKEGALVGAKASTWVDTRPRHRESSRVNSSSEAREHGHWGCSVITNCIRPASGAGTDAGRTSTPGVEFPARASYSAMTAIPASAADNQIKNNGPRIHLLRGSNGAPLTGSSALGLTVARAICGYRHESPVRRRPASTAGLSTPWTEVWMEVASGLDCTPKCWETNRTPEGRIRSATLKARAFARMGRPIESAILPSASAAMPLQGPTNREDVRDHRALRRGRRTRRRGRVGDLSLVRIPSARRSPDSRGAFRCR